MERSGSVQNYNGSGCRRTKNILILRIRNTDANIDKHPSNARKVSANLCTLAINRHCRSTLGQVKRRALLGL
jgi:hypothetical protein